jgi:dihydrofolate synthase / folylpolyglutamate synthase
MTYEESVRALMALGRELAAPQQARVMKFGLENITTLAAALGNPQLAVRCAHVAGTNGKGSTAAMLESIVRAAGLRTGLYTSPHLERINERIRINGESISDEDFAAAWTRVRAAIEPLLANGRLAAHPTFFECITAMAFVAFQQHGERQGAEHGIDFAIYEVGLGGRLDATNIVVPEVAILTPIDFDHENFLGHSIEEIAWEKAGIIKPGAWVVSAAGNPQAAAVVAERSRELNARLVEVDAAWRIGDVTVSDGFYSAAATAADSNQKFEIAPSLPGRFQLGNALTAATAARLLKERGLPVTERAIADGIRNTQWPGRLERLSVRPAVYLDGTHNPAGARELLRFWKENFAGRRICLVYGVMRDKAVDEIAGLLFPAADRVILTEPQQPRAVSASLLLEMTGDFNKNCSVVRNPGEALERALALAAPDDAIFATGSLYLVGDLRKFWSARKSAILAPAALPETL